MKNLILFAFSLLVFSSFASVETSEKNEHEEPEKGDSLVEGNTAEEPSFFDTANVYTEDWNNNVTFWYPQFDYSDSSILNFTDSTLSYAFPVENKTTSGFGRRHSSQHKGIDIPLKTGDTVVSAFDGKVRYAKYNSG